MSILPILFAFSGLVSLVHYSGNGITNSSNTVAIPSTALPKQGNINLWKMEGFQGLVGSNQAFWGSGYYYVGYGSGGETNPSYNWYIVATQYFPRSGSDHWSIGGISTTMDIYSNHFWNVQASPISKSPISTGSATVGLSSSGPSIGVSVGYNGYDTGSVSGGNNGYYGQFNWQHDYTIADQDTWNSMSGAYMAKVSATYSQANVQGQVSISFYEWWTGGWNPFAGTSGWYSAQYNSGAYGTVTYPYSVV